MCGLVGFWQHDDSQEPYANTLYRAAGRVAHRGPEGSRAFETPDFQAVHSQLTFHEPGVSDQPYLSEDEKYIVIFNGQLYNHRDLRDDLQRRGHRFRSRSESEIIHRLYVEYGEAFAGRIRGMFAIVIRDRARDCLILARDPIGKKPLFYARARGAVYFASELQAVHAFIGARRIDPAAFTSFFLCNAVDSRLCLLADVSKVAPGEVTVAERAGIRKLRYWSAETIPARPADAPPAVEALTALLQRGVSRRLLDNGVPLGLMLSGGLDSSLMAAMIADQGHALPSYSARFVDAGFDESGHAAHVAKRYSSAHHIVDIPDDEVPDAITRYFGAVDEPVADPSFLAVALVAAAARGQVKGLLTGDGADDLFAGYAIYRAVPLLTFAGRCLPRPLLAWAERRFADLPGRDGNLTPAAVLRLLSRGTRVPPAWQHAYCTSSLTPGELTAVLTPAARNMVLWPFADEDERTGAAMRQVRLGTLRSFLQAPILTKLDRGSMASGVEIRSPFLDQDVAEFALSLPMSALVTRKGTKTILRTIAERWLPEDVRRRPKQGFRLPVRRLLRGPVRQLLTDTLAPDALRRHGIFDVVAVEALLDQHLRQGLDRSKPLWALLGFNLWQQGFAAMDLAESRSPMADEPLCVPS